MKLVEGSVVKARCEKASPSDDLLVDADWEIENATRGKTTENPVCVEVTVIEITTKRAGDDDGAVYPASEMENRVSCV